MKPLIKKILLFFFVYACFLLFTPVVTWITTDTPLLLLPRFYLMVLWAVPLIILFNIKNIYCKLIGFIWICWFMIGSINVIASYYYYGDFYLVNVEHAHLVYIAFTTTFFLAIFVFERLTHLTTRHVVTFTTALATQVMPKRDIHPGFGAFLIAFPFVWFLSLYYAVGYIPILQGTNIEKDMYKLDFGPLYGFVAINILSMLLIFDRFQSATSVKRYWYLILFVLVAFFSVSNGKRMTIMVFFLALICYLIKTRRDIIFNKFYITIGLTLAVVFYSGMMIIRKGSNIDNYKSTAVQLAIVGVEFRDFAFAINHFKPEQLHNYKWAESSLASGINSKVLKFMGIDKQQAISMSFSYASKSLFSGGFFGIRVGLIGELYFAYQFYGLIIIFIFGLLIGWIGAKIHKSNSQFSLLFLSTTYGLLLITLVSQTIDIIGTLTVLLYTWFIYLFIKALYPTKAAIRLIKEIGAH